MFMKAYGKQKHLCSLALSPPVDPETFWKWTWAFIVVIALLEAQIVSSIFQVAHPTCMFPQFYGLLLILKLFSKTALCLTWGMTV
jgi:hypothetical protein